MNQSDMAVAVSLVKTAHITKLNTISPPWVFGNKWPMAGVLTALPVPNYPAVYAAPVLPEAGAVSLLITGDQER